MQNLIKKNYRTSMINNKRKSFNIRTLSKDKKNNFKKHYKILKIMKKNYKN